MYDSELPVRCRNISGTLFKSRLGSGEAAWGLGCGHTLTPGGSCPARAQRGRPGSRPWALELRPRQVWGVVGARGEDIVTRGRGKARGEAGLE